MMGRPIEPIIIIVMRADDGTEMEFKKAKGCADLWERTDKPLQMFIRNGTLDWNGKIFKLTLTESGI